MIWPDPSPARSVSLVVGYVVGRDLVIKESLVLLHHGLWGRRMCACMQELLVSENACAFTMNRHEFEVLCSATLRQLKDACTQQQGDAGAQGGGGGARGRGGSLFASKPAPATAAGIAEMPGTGMFSELGRDHVLTMIAVSLTYFKLSSRRVVDGVPLLIMHHLLGRCVGCGAAGTVLMIWVREHVCVVSVLQPCIMHSPVSCQAQCLDRF